jgi:large repetitive protein
MPNFASMVQQEGTRSTAVTTLSAPTGTPPYSWFVVNNINELPPGLTLDTTAPDFNNVLAGTPTQAGTFSFPMQVQDSQDNTVNATLTITINP